MFYSLKRWNLCCALHWCPVLLCKGYLVEPQYFRKFYSQSLVKTRHLNTNQSGLVSRSAGVACL